jgi:hypothetical protein
MHKSVVDTSAIGKQGIWIGDTQRVTKPNSPPMKFLNFFNARTFTVLVFSEVAAFVTIHFHLRLDMNLMLFGLAIGFPLAFSIQSAFGRRDRALEYFSLVKSGAQAISHTFDISEDLPAENRAEGKETIIEMVDQLILQLEARVTDHQAFQNKADAVLAFIERNREFISNRNVIRAVRYLRDVNEGSTYLISLVRHRTMAGLRFYAILFIMVFPFIQAPMLLYRIEPIAPLWTLYVFAALSSLLLITLYNFQQMIEYPFDNKGLDNIRVRDFRMNTTPQRHGGTE